MQTRDPKLSFSVPLFPGISVKIADVTLPVGTLLRVLRPLSRFSDVGQWASTVRFVLDFTFEDMHTEGDYRGGWGKRYAAYLAQTYSAGAPSDASRQPDTPSGTSIVMSDFLTLLQVPDLVSGEARAAIEQSLGESTKYLIDRYDPKTGAEGVLVGLSVGDKALAPNLRHAANAFKVWRRLPGQYERLGKCSGYIIATADEKDLRQERPLTNAPVYSALATIESSPSLVHSMAETAKISYLLAKTATGLISTWDEPFEGWCDSSDRSGTLIWYTASVLRDLAPWKTSLTPLLAGRFNKSLAMLLGHVRTISDGAGIPYRKGGEPDLGMSCMLLDILSQCEIPTRDDNRISTLSRFITGCCAGAPGSNGYLRDTYPWTLTSLFSGIQHLLRP